MASRSAAGHPADNLPLFAAAPANDVGRAGMSPTLAAALARLGAAVKANPGRAARPLTLAERQEEAIEKARALS
jgi:hypothetical protein